jgi:hypothetical protein
MDRTFAFPGKCYTFPREGDQMLRGHAATVEAPMKLKKSKSESKEDAAAKPFTRADFHNLLKRAAIPRATKPAPKSA